MKYLILTSLLLSFTSIFAQKTDKTKIDYELEMYPIELISKEKKVDVIIDYTYKSKVEESNSEIAERKDQAARDKEEYDKKSYGEKLLATKVMGEARPTGVYNNNSFIPTLFPEDAVKAQVVVPGYTKVKGSKGSITILFSELSYTVDPTKTKINYNPLQVVLTIVNDKGATVYSGSVPNNWITRSTNSVTPSDLEKNMISTLKGAEASAKNLAIENINTYLKINYGYNTVKNDRTFFDVKDKKQSYPECHEAIEKVKNAFVYVNTSDKQDVMISKLKDAIAIWEKSLAELDKSNKDARINKDVAAALYLNIAEASIWTKEFDKAYEALANHKALDEDYSRTYKDVSEFLKDYSTRYNKYKQY